MDTLAAFKAEVEAFLERKGIEPTTFGRDALKDPNFVIDLRAGRSPHLRTIEKVRAFMRKVRATA